MNVKEAIVDPKRPLSVSPQKWAGSEKLRRGSLIGKPEKEKKNEDELILIEGNIDEMLGLILEIYDNYETIDYTKYPENIKVSMDKIKDLFDHAITPYFEDVAKELEKLEE